MKRRLKRSIIAAAVVAVLIVAGILIAQHWLSGSSNGTVSVGVSAGKSAGSSKPLALATSYFTTELPAGYIVKRHTETPQDSLVQLQVVADGGVDEQQQAAFTTGLLPSDGLRGLGDYNLRFTSPATYAQTDLPALPTGAIAFRNLTGLPGLTVFWPHGPRYAEIAISTDGGTTEAQQINVYAEIVARWAWL